MYSKLLKLINLSTEEKPTKLNLNHLRYTIEEIYSLKFLKETQAILKNEEENEDFPIFVGNYFINKYNKKDILDKKILDFTSSINFYSKNYKDIQIFSYFLNEEYDIEDLIFYLFVRSCIEKELKIFFVEKTKEFTNDFNNENNEIFVPIKSCKKIGNLIYGNDKSLISSFLSVIEKIIKNEHSNTKITMISSSAILNASVEDYHNSRIKYENEEVEEEEKELEINNEIIETENTQIDKENIKEIIETNEINKTTETNDDEIKINNELIYNHINNSNTTSHISSNLSHNKSINSTRNNNRIIINFNNSKFNTNKNNGNMSTRSNLNHKNPLIDFYNNNNRHSKISINKNSNSHKKNKSIDQISGSKFDNRNNVNHTNKNPLSISFINTKNKMNKSVDKTNTSFSKNKKVRPTKSIDKVFDNKKNNNQIKEENKNHVTFKIDNENEKENENNLSFHIAKDKENPK